MTSIVPRATICDVRFASIVLLAAALSHAWAADNTVRPELSFTKTIGGNASTTGVAVASDTLGNIYLAGTTMAQDFPVLNAFQKRIGGTPLRASTDGGKTWTASGIADPVYAVAGSPRQPSVVYAGTANAMYKSTDSGKSWTVLPSAGNALVNALWLDPENPAVVHAATDKGMIKSDDAGATWGAASTAQGNVLALGASPARPATLFAAMDIGAFPQRSSLYRSVDGGATWSVLPNAPLGPYALACDPAAPGVLYLATSTAGFSSAGTTALYKSTNSGDSWSLVSSARLVVSTWTVAATADTVYLATRDGLLRSSDGGVSWRSTSIAVSASAVATDPARPQSVYVSADSGLFASTDAGATWTLTLPVRQLVEVVAVAPTVPPTVFIGAAPGRNIFVSKWSPDGSRLLYSTYLGGSYYDYVTGIAVDRQGNAYVTGFVYSTDFPVTSNAIQPKHGGSYDAFLSKIGPNGDTLVYSTYLGGAAADAAFGIALDSAANVYLTGYAGSAEFPVTPGAVQTRLLDNARCKLVFFSSVIPSRLPAADAFVVKIDPSSGALGYSTFLGGQCYDEGIGIAVDSAGSAYIAGATASPDFPVTAGALQRDYGDPEATPNGAGVASTGFLAKLSPQGTAVSYATYLGGGFGSNALGVAVDSKGAAYVTGVSSGFDQSRYPPNRFNSSAPPAGLPTVGFSAFQGGAAFVAKIDPAGAALQYLRYLGGTWGAGTGIALDASGAAWVAGRTLTPVTTEPFPTLHPFQAKTGYGFVSSIAADGALAFSTLVDSAQQIALDSSGNGFIAGSSATSALLTRIDGAALRAMTIEEPRQLAPLTPTMSGAGGVSAGQIVEIPGAGLGPVQPAAAQLDADGNIRTSLGGTSVTFDGLAAPLLSTQSDRILCIVPFGLRPPGSLVTVQARSAGAVSNAIRLPVVASAIQILGAVNSDGTVNSREHPAPAGSIVALYGTGFGQSNPPGRDGRINEASPATFTSGRIAVTVGPETAQVVYAGPAPGQAAGIVQINFRLPQLAPGPHTAVVGWAQPGYPDSHAVSIWVRQPD